MRVQNNHADVRVSMTSPGKWVSQRARFLVSTFYEGRAFSFPAHFQFRFRSFPITLRANHQLLSFPIARGSPLCPVKSLSDFMTPGAISFQSGKKRLSQPISVAPIAGSRCIGSKQQEARHVFSCHCFVAVCGRPNGTVLVSEHLWVEWIADAFNH